jgi:hypothetical protein
MFDLLMSAVVLAACAAAYAMLEWHEGQHGP